jgi:hypothetical protein
LSTTKSTRARPRPGGSDDGTLFELVKVYAPQFVRGVRMSELFNVPSDEKRWLNSLKGIPENDRRRPGAIWNKAFGDAPRARYVIEPAQVAFLRGIKVDTWFMSRA